MSVLHNSSQMEQWGCHRFYFMRLLYEKELYNFSPLFKANKFSTPFSSSQHGQASILWQIVFFGWSQNRTCFFLNCLTGRLQMGILLERERILKIQTVRWTSSIFLWVLSSLSSKIMMMMETVMNAGIMEGTENKGRSQSNSRVKVDYYVLWLQTWDDLLVNGNGRKSRWEISEEGGIVGELKVWRWKQESKIKFGRSTFRKWMEMRNKDK